MVRKLRPIWPWIAIILVLGLLQVALGTSVPADPMTDHPPSPLLLSDPSSDSNEALAAMLLRGTDFSIETPPVMATPGAAGSVSAAFSISSAATASAQSAMQQVLALLRSINLSASTSSAAAAAAAANSNSVYPLLQSIGLSRYTASIWKWDLGGLEAWTSIAWSIRTRMYSLIILDPTVGTAGLNFNGWSATVLQGIKPTIVFAGIWIGAAGLMVLISPYACHHALKYGCCGKRRWPTASPGRKTKDAARVLRFKKMFGAVFLCQLIFVICLAQGNSQLTRGLAAAIGGVGNVVQTSTTFLAQAKPLVQSLVTPVTTGFGVALDGAVSSTLDLSLIPFTASINSVVGPTTSALVSAASSLAQGNSLVATMVSEQITLSSNLIQLQSQLTALSSASAALNTQHTVSGTGEVYRLTNAITGLPTASSLAIPSTSQATTGVNSVSNSVAAIPGLNALASTLTSQASTIDPQIRAQVSSFTNAFKQTFATTLIPTVNAYLPMLDADVSSSPVGMASNTLLQLYKSSIDASNTINSAESARYFVTLVIGAFFVVSCLGTGLSIVIRSPGAPRRCGCINYCLGIVIFLMGGVFFAVTMAVEMVCSDIAPATSTLPHASPLYFTSSATVGGGSSSANGKSMRALGAMFSSTVATCGTGAAATSPFDALNASYYQVSSAIPMLQDYMPLPTSLTLTGMVKSTVASDEAQLSRSLSSVVSSNGQVYLGTSNTIMSGLVTQVNSAGYSGNLALVNALPSTIDSSGLTTFKSSLTSLRSSLTTSSFTYQSPAYTAAQKQNVLTSFQAQIDGVTAQIDTMVSLASTASSQLAQYRTHASTLTSTLIMFQSQISNANSNYQSIVQAINTLTSSISSSISTKLFPAIDAAESSFADSVNLVIATQWSCQPAGQAVVATVNAMCFTMLPGLDAYWFACVMSGLAAITMFVLGVHLSQAMETEKLMTVVPPGQESQQGKGGEKVVWEMSAIQASAPVTPC